MTRSKSGRKRKKELLQLISDHDKGKKKRRVMKE
jgi:hypothetical protein